MNEIIKEEPFEYKSNEILLESLKNIIICLFNEKAEEIRKTIFSNNSEGKIYFFPTLFNLLRD